MDGAVKDEHPVSEGEVTSTINSCIVGKEGSSNKEVSISLSVRDLV